MHSTVTDQGIFVPGLHLVVPNHMQLKTKGMNEKILNEDAQQQECSLKKFAKQNKANAAVISSRKECVRCCQGGQRRCTSTRGSSGA